MNDRERLLTPGEVAKRLGVSPKTVTRWFHDGTIAGFRTPGGHLRIPEYEVERIRGVDRALA